MNALTSEVDFLIESCGLPQRENRAHLFPKNCSAGNPSILKARVQRDNICFCGEKLTVVSCTSTKSGTKGTKRVILQSTPPEFDFKACESPVLRRLEKKKDKVCNVSSCSPTQPCGRLSREPRVNHLPCKSFGGHTCLFHCGTEFAKCVPSPPKWQVV